MIWTNYHGHCKYCDGNFAPEEYAKRAIDKDFLAYGFSSHSPLPIENGWSMKEADIEKYLQDIELLKGRYYSKLEIYTGLEADYIEGISSPKELKVRYNLDYVIGSVHYAGRYPDGKLWEIDGDTKSFQAGLKAIYNNNIRKCISTYYGLIRDMIDLQTPDIVGHLDKIKIHNADNIYFSEFDKWYQTEVISTLKAIKDRGCILEVNTRGIYTRKNWQTYPSRWILEKAYELKIPVTLTSDAHHPEEINMAFERSAAMLNDVGYKKMTILWQGKWQNVPFDQKGLKIDIGDKDTKMAS
ncbi:histidinol-phosphatase [Fulvivirga ulvae]|uniref:histidinol-phosphatase n=1 Tax=Fulvivirga ulvae TaxID=2904245 RepID=UPI001F186663|nr:histidinol-phosphatase [Fulvivirga ulvae]UII29579.1 histidinol-phosphatase [Fulvivirga ulvae]